MVKRDINFLLKNNDFFIIHVTVFGNLKSILECGLKSIKDLNQGGIKPIEMYGGDLVDENSKYNGFYGFKIKKENLGRMFFYDKDVAFIINPLDLRYEIIDSNDFPDEVLIKSILINNKTIISVVFNNRIIKYDVQNKNKIEEFIKELESRDITVITLDFDDDGNIVKDSKDINNSNL